MTKPKITARQFQVMECWHRNGQNARRASEELGFHHSYVSRVVKAVQEKIEGAASPAPVPSPANNRPGQGLRILMIPDCQVKPGVDLAWLRAIGRYIVHKRPDVIVNIGDFWDFESLSHFDRGRREFEGRRLKADIDAGNAGMEALLGPLREAQEEGLDYHPRMVFTMGNHEERADRFASEHPELHGVVGSAELRIEQWGWEVHPFLQPVEIAGIHFVHYLANPFSGRPYGGSALNQLKNVGNSFCVGHKQTLDVAMRPVLNGGHQIGVIAGASYVHDEAYKGPQGNNHFRGVVMLHEAQDGSALPMFVSTRYLLRRYGEEQ